jgi:hypothetical protein
MMKVQAELDETKIVLVKTWLTFGDQFGLRHSYCTFICIWRVYECLYLPILAMYK